MSLPINFTVPEISGMKAMREGGATWDVIAVHFGTSSHSVVQTARRHNFWSQDVRRHIVTPEEIEGMRAMRFSGSSWEAIEKTYCLDFNTIRKTAKDHGFDVPLPRSGWPPEVLAGIEQHVTKTQSGYGSIAAQLCERFGITISASQVRHNARQRGLTRGGFVPQITEAPRITSFMAAEARQTPGKPEDNRVRRVPPGTHAAPAGGYRMGMV